MNRCISLACALLCLTLMKGGWYCARQELRCFVCLRKHHISRDCQSSARLELLQTAKLQLYNLDDISFPPSSVELRAIMDSGSQRTYVTHVSFTCPRSLHIKTLGSTKEWETVCEAVELGLITRNGEKLSALVVPFICDPVTSQPISHFRECYDHL